MTIIKIEPLESGVHPIKAINQKRTLWLDGYIEVPSHLESDIWDSLGWCDLDIQDGKLIGITSIKRPPELEPAVVPPTETEQLRADVDFLSAMTGVTL